LNHSGEVFGAESFSTRLLIFYDLETSGTNLDLNFDGKTNLLDWAESTQLSDDSNALVRIADTKQKYTLIFLEPEININDYKTHLENAGGQVHHVFPNSALIVTPPEEEPLPDGVEDAITQQISDLNTLSITPEKKFAIEVWNNLLAEQDIDFERNDLDQYFSKQDVLPVEEDFPDVLGAITAPNVYKNTYYMAGSVTVSIIFPESNGVIDPSSEDWTIAERQKVFNEIVNGLNWWTQFEPRANLSFVYDNGYENVVQTSYEPITHSYPESIEWLNEIMTNKGYVDDEYVHMKVRRFDDSLRNQYGTDWAFTIFVADSSNDTDGKFSDGHFAYTVGLGSSYVMMTYDNSGYGIGNMDAVIAHEFGHEFFAFDQYFQAYKWCNLFSGYLEVTNNNSQYRRSGEDPCLSGVSSIMRGQTYPFKSNDLDIYAAGELGFKDTCGIDQQTGEIICDDLPVYATTYDTRNYYPGETTEHSDGLLDFIGSIQVIPSQITKETLVTVKIVAYRTDAYINFIRQVYIKGSDGRKWILATGERGTYEVKFQIPDTIPLGEYGIDLDLVVENYIGGTYIQNLQKGINVATECHGDLPRRTPVAPLKVVNGITSLPPYERTYKPLRIYLFGKNDDTNTIDQNDEIDYSYCYYDLEQDGCHKGPDRNYLIIGFNDYSGEARVTYPANHILLTIDNTVIPVSIPSFTFSGQPKERYYFYVADDGSLYHANSAKKPITAERYYESINLSPSQAFQPEYRASYCLSEVPLPPLGAFDAVKGTGGDPAYLNTKIYINSQLQTNKEVFLFTYSRNPAVPAAWTKTTTNSSGNLVLSNLYNYSNYGYYYLIYPLFSSDNTDSTIFFDPDNRYNTQMTVPSRKNMYFDGTVHDKKSLQIPVEGAASVSGKVYVLIGGGSAPIWNIPMYIINVDDTDQVFSLRMDQNGFYSLENIHSGRYLFVTEYWDGPNLYAPHFTDIYKALVPGENTVDILLR